MLDEIMKVSTLTYVVLRGPLLPDLLDQCNHVSWEPLPNWRTPTPVTA